MTLDLYQVDAFTNQLFKGNPAAVVPLESWLPDETMQAIAAENNLAETAFIIPKGADFELRWFTPAIEVRLCGHATLATAFVLFEHLNYQGEQIRFHTESGILTVEKEDDFLVMNFPADELEEVEVLKVAQDGLGAKIEAFYKGKDDYLAVLESQKTLEQLSPDFRRLAQLKSRGIIVTARGNEFDFVSRGFFPQAGIDEDPVTGSAHTTLTPYWAKTLGKQTLTARQLSERTGDLICTLQEDRVLLKGQAVLYLIGKVRIA
ncbi:MAG: PhzF family phenazine biosynthesis protein [Bacteroidota bacterium]